MSRLTIAGFVLVLGSMFVAMAFLVVVAWEAL